MSEFQGTIIFVKHHIFDPMQAIFNPPVPLNACSKVLSGRR
jgi:hypothetical protein